MLRGVSSRPLTVAFEGNVRGAFGAQCAGEGSAGTPATSKSTVRDARGRVGIEGPGTDSDSLLRQADTPKVAASLRHSGSLFPVPCSLFPVPGFLFPVSCSLFPVSCSRFPVALGTDGNAWCLKVQENKTGGDTTTTDRGWSEGERGRRAERVRVRVFGCMGVWVCGLGAMARLGWPERARACGVRREGARGGGAGRAGGAA